MYMQQPQLPANYAECASQPSPQAEKSGGWRWNTEHMETLSMPTLICLQMPKGSQRENTNQLNIVTEKFVLYPARLKLDVDKNVLGGGM